MTNLSAEYERQFALRPWSQLLDLLPDVSGKLVLDLGCAIGDQTAELVARGARVIGLDADEALLSTAQVRGLVNAEFRAADLREPLEVDGLVDGIWSSFAAAYFPDLGSRLREWKRHLGPDGWIALTEIDDLFGHEPVSLETNALLAEHARDALASGRYDFHMGHKLQAHLESAGFVIEKAIVIDDREFSFDGPAAPEVLTAWTARLDRMRGLQRFCGASFEHVREDLLAALRSPNHRSTATVHCCLARAKGLP